MMRLSAPFKALCAALMLVCAAFPAAAQAQALGQALGQAPQEARVIRQIQVEGVLRVEPNTVISYLSLRPGDVYDPALVDMSLDTLAATGLFSDIAFELTEEDILVVRVEESPIINRVIFEGNNAMDNDELTAEIEAAPRTVFTRARVQADAQRIIELYRRSGRFAATVTPQIVELDQNRVDLIFEIAEGQITNVRRVNFIGNEEFSDNRLRRVIATEEARFWRFFSSNTNYDPDRLDYDRELLREFYADRGFAQFRVASAVAELTPDQQGFYVTFTVDEGEQFRYGDITVSTELDALDSDYLRALVPLRRGEDYVGSQVDNAVDLLTFAAGTAGYAFVDIQAARIPNEEDNTVDIEFSVSEGPRVYIERIDILGNTQTLDRVIRRQMQLVEGDAFNQVLLDRSQNRVQALGYFEDVEVDQVQGSRADSTVVQVSVTEQPTGELSFGAGYSSVDAFLIDLQVTQRNLRGRGQTFRFAVALSSRRSTVDVRFREPAFLGRNLSAGVDLFRIETDFASEAGFETTSTGGSVRMGFPVSDRASLGLQYTLRTDEVRAFSGASAQIAEADGSFLTSLVGYSVNWDYTNDAINPTRGFEVQLAQEFAGVGGDVQFVGTTLQGAAYRGIWRDVVGSFLFNAGYIEGWGGDDVRLNDRYFIGGFTFRGFETAGIGPRTIQEITDETTGETTVRGLDSLGGKLYAVGAFELSFPLGLPEQYGVSGGLFTEFGTLGVLDDSSKPVFNDPSIRVVDELALRASAGVTIYWNSPFGPVRFDFSRVLAKEEYDRTETFRFSQSTRW